ncbi:MAG: cytochrome c oxidase subunit II [Flavobacteriales bacterium]|nr:cytochrome c oxidase subunit II [Flavobacteriales bacterium]
MINNILFILITVLSLLTISRIIAVSNLIDTIRGRKPWEVTLKENGINAFLCLMMVFFGWFLYFYFYIKYVRGGLLLPEAASLHGKDIDVLSDVSFTIISVAYLLVQPFLWYFAFRYRMRPEGRAYHFAHNTRLEMVWTIVPAIIFCTLIFYGLKIWIKVFFSETEGDKLTVELYAQQFSWTARYAGSDKKLGEANYCMISDNNQLGIITPETIDEQIAKIGEKYKAVLHALDNFPDPAKFKELKRERELLTHQMKVLSDLKKQSAQKPFADGQDDIVILPAVGEFHIPVGRPVELKMRSQDVIHSAYLPHFRVHMYCSPGSITTFTFTPTITTQEMREKLAKEDFDFLLYCNNICGSAHFNMQMKVIVETEEQFNLWLSQQKTFSASRAPANSVPADTAKTSAQIATL